MNGKSQGSSGRLTNGKSQGSGGRLMNGKAQGSCAEKRSKGYAVRNHI